MLMRAATAVQYATFTWLVLSFIVCFIACYIVVVIAPLLTRLRVDWIQDKICRSCKMMDWIAEVENAYGCVQTMIPVRHSEEPPFQMAPLNLTITLTLTLVSYTLTLTLNPSYLTSEWRPDTQMIWSSIFHPCDFVCHFLLLQIYAPGQGTSFGWVWGGQTYNRTKKINIWLAALGSTSPEQKFCPSG